MESVPHNEKCTLYLAEKYRERIHDVEGKEKGQKILENRPDSVDKSGKM